ncbi:MAG TPA: ATP-binding protein [Thermofilaceae archaeon]|nr:ATP-binding protein [Thermofilaceae archaeon]
MLGGLYRRSLGVLKPSSLALTGDVIPLLPQSLMPPAEEAGDILLGFDEFGREVYVDFSKLPNAHAVVTGTTGSGKSTLARSLSLSLLERDINVVFIDPHGEHAQFIENLGGVVVSVEDSPPNVLDPAGFSPQDWGEMLSALLTEVTGIGGLLGSLLRPAMRRAVEKGDLRIALRSLSSTPEVLESVRPVLEPLVRPRLCIERMLEAGVPLCLVLREKKRLAIEQRAKFLSCVLLAQVQSIMSSRGVRHRPELIVIIDEAHRLLSLTTNPILRAYQETRKFGFGFWSLTQLPSLIPLEIYQLVGFSVFLGGSKEYVEELSALAFLTDTDREWLLYGVKGYAVVVRQGDPRPRRVKLAIRREALSLTG